MKLLARLFFLSFVLVCLLPTAAQGFNAYGWWSLTVTLPYTLMCVAGCIISWKLIGDLFK